MNNEMTKLDKFYKSLQKKYVLFLLLLIVAVIVTVITPVIGVIFIALILIAQVFYLRKQVKQYKKDYVHANILLGFNSKIKSINHNDKDGISKEKAIADNLFLISDDVPFLARELIQGCYCRKPISLCEMTVCYPYKNDSGKKAYTYISGVYVRVSLDSNICPNFSWYSEELEDILPLPKQAYTETPDPEGFFESAEIEDVSADIWDKIKHLSNAESFACRKIDDKFFLFMNNTFYSILPKRATKPDITNLSYDRFPYMDMILQLVDSIYMKGKI